MSPTPSADYGTDNALAFAHFVAGLFAERTGRTALAAQLYTAAMRLDSDYHKALNNRGFLMQAEGAQVYVKRIGDGRARQLFEDAAGLFARAKVFKNVAEYHYNYATTLSYLGYLDLRGEDRLRARGRQLASIAAYKEALRAIDEHIAETLAQQRWWWWHLPRRTALEKLRTEREGFRRSIQLALAISCVLARQLDDKTKPTPEELLSEEKTALDHVLAAFAGRSRVTSHPRLEYNLACYYAVTQQWDQAISLFIKLRSVTPALASQVLADPDVALLPQILALFTPTPAEPAVATPAPSDSKNNPEHDPPT